MQALDAYAAQLPGERGGRALLGWAHVTTGTFLFTVTLALPSYLPLFPGLPAKPDIFYSPSTSIYPSYFSVPQLPVCPGTLLVWAEPCFLAPKLFVSTLLPISSCDLCSLSFSQWLVTCNPNNVPDVLSSCKAIPASPCIPSEAGFLLCTRTSPFFPLQRALYTSSLFPSCPVGKSFCVHTIFLSEGFLLSCLYQSVCIFTASPSHPYCLGR